jgi:hypothetical protein
MHERHLVFLEAEREQWVYMDNFEAHYIHWINTEKDFPKTDVRDHFRRIVFIDVCREPEQHTQTAKEEFKTAVEWYSAVALRTGPEFEDDEPGLEGEEARMRLDKALVSTWLEGSVAAPPVDRGDRTPLPVVDQETFLVEARSI